MAFHKMGSSVAMKNEDMKRVDETSTPQFFTSLPDGNRVRKDDARMEACGTIDELNSNIGLLASEVPVDLGHELHIIQRRLFSIGAHLVGVTEVAGFPGESEIDHLQSRIAEMRNIVGASHCFILPGGCRSASLSHVCRTVCRRAERCAVALNSYPDVLYLNKLSTYFFYLSLYLNYFNGIDEIKV